MSCTNSVYEFTYTYGARWYDATGRLGFTTIDPLCEEDYSVSPYVYCRDNPINAIDPDGRKIVLTGNRGERDQILSDLQALSNNQLEIDKKGVLFVKNIGNMNTNNDLSIGTHLISELITNKRTMRISVSHENVNVTNDELSANASNGIGTNVSITYNPIRLSISTVNPVTGKLQAEYRPSYIGLGHELIHGIRDMKGIAIPYEKKANYTYVDFQGKTKETSTHFEELIVVGLKGNYKYTENKIRKEHGFNLRGKY